jgi:diguanylate cyclase (GGDEF)-like protein/PAS domain S-box-containing protein
MSGPAADDPGRGSVPSSDWVYIHNLLDASDEVIYFKDHESRFIRVSAGCARLHRCTQADLIGLTDHDLFLPEHADTARADELRILATGEPIVDHEEWERWPDRGDTWVSTSKFPLRGVDGSIIGTFGISRDITRRARAEQEKDRAAEALRAALARTSILEAQLRRVLDGSRDPIITYDTDLRCRYLNPAAESLRGRGARETIGRTDREAGEPDAWVNEWEPVLRVVLASGAPQLVEIARKVEGETRWYQASLTPERDAQGDVTGVLAALREITEMKRAGEVLSHQATHCALTGLANRYLLLDRAARALARLERSPATVVVLFIDLDGFKAVNDTYGHAVGDLLLIEVARRLELVARRTDTVARLGGDEFVLLCESSGTSAYARLIAFRIVRALAAPYLLAYPSQAEGGAPLQVNLTASVGVVATNDASATPERLLSNADAAMYEAKEGGGNSYRFFPQGGNE